MRLIDVYDFGLSAGYLYELLKERTPEQSISHRKMPTWEEHVEFVQSRPYSYWYLIELSGLIVGATYLTRQREIGISLYRGYQGNGYGRQAVNILREKHPGRILANVNPNNTPSRKFWESMGGELLQVTYELA